MFKVKTLKNLNLKKKRVLLRVDFNIPLGKNLKPDKSETWRIEATIPTIKYLMRQKSKIILISHLGRPNGRDNKEFSLKPIVGVLRKLLNKKIIFSEINSNTEKVIDKMNFGDILLLENVRFYKGEENNLIQFSKRLAKLGDFFVNDAFSVSHRKHASIIGVPKFLPSAIGLLFEKEIKELNKILRNPRRPLLTIIGGAKISTKIKVIDKFLKIADKVIIGGSLANTIFSAQGKEMGVSTIEKKSFSEIKKINLKSKKAVLPIDLSVLNKGKATDKKTDELNKKDNALDAGLESIEMFYELIKKSKTVIWNGPLGLMTQKPFDRSTIKIIEAISKSKTYSIAGGGDTVVFLRRIKKEKIFNHLSTGGGAMLDYLVHETLPGIKALK